MTTPLSLAAKAVLDAFRTSHTGQGCLAAALRAAADQVVPKTPTLSHDHFYPEDYELGVWVANDDTRTELLAIAAELERQ